MEMIESCVPPGFRFHPTEEELVGYYLRRKINSLRIDLNIIVDIDLYNMEPWDIQERCKLLGHEEQKEWYFFSHKDKKYPTGTRTNRATAHGFWKATGRDKAVLSKNKIIGMRKTLVFYRGRAPNGRKSDWIVHEYRLQTSEYALSQEEGWVVCRAFKKPIPSDRLGYEAWARTHSHPQTVNPTQSQTQPIADSTIQNQDNLSFLHNSTAFHHALEALPPLLDSPCPTTSMNGNYEITLMPVQKSFDLTAEDIDFDDDWKMMSGFLIPDLMENNNCGSTSLLPWEI